MTPKKLIWRKTSPINPQWDSSICAGSVKGTVVAVTISRFAEDCFTTRWTIDAIGLEGYDYATLNAAKRGAQKEWQQFVYSLFNE